MSPNHLILCRPLLLLPSIFPSIRVFWNESALHIRWPKYWSFSFSISPSNEYSGLISFRMDWLDLFAVQGTLKSLLHHHSSKSPLNKNQSPSHLPHFYCPLATHGPGDYSGLHKRRTSSSSQKELLHSAGGKAFFCPHLQRQQLPLESDSSFLPHACMF